MDKIRIAIVGTPNYPIPAVKGGAIETLVTALLEENENKSLLDITVFTIDHPLLEKYKDRFTSNHIVSIPPLTMIGQIKEGIYKVIRKSLGYSILPYNEYMRKVNKILCRDRYNLILFESTQNEVMQLDTKNGAKVAYHIHADYLNDSMPGIKRVMSQCDSFIGISNYISGKISQINVLHNSSIDTLLNAVSVSEIQNAIKHVDRSSIRKRLNLDNEVTLLYCGRLSPEKGILELVDAVKKVKKCKLVIVGGADFSSTKLTPYVKKVYEHAQQCDNRVQFTGYVDHDKIWEYLAAADIAVVPSICNEAASLALLEFRSAGLCTIASKRGGIPEYTDDSKSLLLETNDTFVDQLAEKIEYLIYNPEIRYEMAKRASDGLAEFDYPAYYQRFVKLVNKIVKE